MIKIEGLKKAYKGFSLDCSIEVNAGQITGLIGQNGAGKTTVFKAILGLISSEGGKVSVFGKDVNALTAQDRENIGVVLSDSGFSGYLAVKDIVPILNAMYKNFDREAFLTGAKKFGLPLDKKIKDFSSGMKTRLKLLVAMSYGARLLILDEPTAGLDVVARDELLSLLREYMAQNAERAILISSHISSDLEGLCDDVYMIDKGSIILHEDTDRLIDEYGIIKLSGAQYAKIDKEQIICSREETYGLSCLTADRKFYIENYPDITVEKGSIDTVISMLIKGRKL